MKSKRLVFVYNATLNPVSLVKDFINEILPQKKGDCNLCSLTYSLVFQKKEWKEFIDKLPYPSTFLLKDRFIKKYGANIQASFPAVFIEDDSVAGMLKLVISAEEINSTTSLQELMQLVEDAIQKG